MPSYDSIIVCIYMAKVNNNASNNAFNLSRDKRNWNYIIGILGYLRRQLKLNGLIFHRKYKVLTDIHNNANS